ncbi:MAG: hypothetical protein NWE94_01760 [Candidatus Bathyarchaeota archaeon]|nr:hypothetical protein [Candidatus Bathyarchaeota archaeon]
MADDLCRLLVEGFLESSWPCVEALVAKLAVFKAEENRPRVTLFQFKNGKRVDSTFNGNHFFLRGSVEYSNPQLTVEEAQGVIGTRLLATCGNYFSVYGLHKPEANDIAQICEALQKPPEGRIVPFLLNTDDVEPDRYSMNPLKSSIATSGQGAFPAAYVKTDSLALDSQFVARYEGKLVTRNEAELVSRCLENAAGSYVDFVDAVKYAQLTQLSEVFSMDLTLHALRLPLATLQSETHDGLLHHVISEAHRNYDAVKQAYDCMGRSMTKRTTLLTVPHSPKGYGSKRAARGRIHFDGNKLTSVSVTYQTTRLYPNDIDPEDISVAQAKDNFTVRGEALADYRFAETPSSPQFFLYSLASPENAALWHGIGAFGSLQLLQSYAAARAACSRGELVRDLTERFGVSTEVPLQFNLAPECMWVHPVHRNIDASIGCVENLADLARMGMKLEYLSAFS